MAKKMSSVAAAQEPKKRSAADAIALLKNDHRTVEQLFKKFEAAKSGAEQQQLARRICNELIAHTKLEEEIFYAACREKEVDDDALDEAQVEHDGAKILITELMTAAAQSPFFEAKVTVLSEYIKHHVKEEEGFGGIFAKAKKAGVDMKALGQRLQARKQELTQEAETEGFELPEPLSFEHVGRSSESQRRSRGAEGEQRVPPRNGGPERRGPRASHQEHKGWQGDSKRHAVAARRARQHRS